MLAMKVCHMRESALTSDATRRAVDPEGWLDTGDIAAVDADGFVYIKDRRASLSSTTSSADDLVKDIIIRGGENVSCALIRLYRQRLIGRSSRRTWRMRCTLTRPSQKRLRSACRTGCWARRSARS